MWVTNTYVGLIYFYFTVTAQEGPGIVIVHPTGQDVELLCTVKSGRAAWLINYSKPYGMSALRNGILKGYSANAGSNNLIVKNVTMNDIRNNTEYRCGLKEGISIIRQSDSTILYIAGEYHYIQYTCLSCQTKQHTVC